MNHLLGRLVNSFPTKCTNATIDTSEWVNEKENEVLLNHFFFFMGVESLIIRLISLDL